MKQYNRWSFDHQSLYITTTTI